MASSKFLVVLALCFTCLALANSASFGNKPYEQTETVNSNDAKKPQQWRYTGWCMHGCCYTGPNGCFRCCRYANEEPNSVGVQKRSRSQVGEKSSKEEEASPVWAQSLP